MWIFVSIFQLDAAFGESLLPLIIHQTSHSTFLIESQICKIWITNISISFNNHHHFRSTSPFSQSQNSNKPQDHRISQCVWQESASAGAASSKWRGYPFLHSPSSSFPRYQFSTLRTARPSSVTVRFNPFRFLSPFIWFRLMGLSVLHFHVMGRIRFCS